MASQNYGAPSTLTTRISTGMNSLTDGSQATSSNLSNDAGSTEGFEFANLELSLAAPASARTSERVLVYLEHSLDGGTTWSDNQELVAIFTLPLDTTAYDGVARGIRLPNSDYRYVVENETGVSFASSGNTLDEEKYKLETN